MSRREAREAAFTFLYQLEFRDEPVAEQRAQYLEQHPLEEEDIPYFTLITDGVFEEREKLDEIYAPYLKDWKLSRLPKVDVILLRIAVYEMLHIEDVPTNVSISEAVILTKRYSTEDSRAYINAVLGKVGRALEK
ncbi:MAG: transcription antitermination factor NusB [Clostridiales bacterium]|nr:transcription antitermination factor NusB [Clostridiales bacterium]